MRWNFPIWVLNSLAALFSDMRNRFVIAPILPWGFRFNEGLQIASVDRCCHSDMIVASSKSECSFCVEQSRAVLKLFLRVIANDSCSSCAKSSFSLQSQGASENASYFGKGADSSVVYHP